MNLIMQIWFSDEKLYITDMQAPNFHHEFVLR